MKWRPSLQISEPQRGGGLTFLRHQHVWESAELAIVKRDGQGVCPGFRRPRLEDSFVSNIRDKARLGKTPTDVQVA